MKTRRSIAAVLLVVPCLLLLLWHLSNNAVPSDDAADFAETALQVAQQFHQEGPLHGMAAAFEIRGWRPIIFPVLAVPFLLITGNDLVAACAATLLLIQLALTIYLYRLARLFTADELAAAAACASALSLPFVASYSVMFFSESAWVLFSVACVYYLLRDGIFKTHRSNLEAGVCGGLMVAVRPVESIIVLAILAGFLLWAAARAKVVRPISSLAAISPFLIPAVLLLLSAWKPGLTRLYILAALGAAGITGLVLQRRLHSAFWTFIAMLVSVACTWWAGFMPALRGWAEGARAYNSKAGVTAMGSGMEIGQTLLRQAREYGGIQMAVLGVLALVLIGSKVVRIRRGPVVADGESDTPAQAWLVFQASLVMLAIFGALYSSGGSDPRRGVVAVTLFITSVVAIAATHRRVVIVAVLCLVTAQFTVIANAVGRPATIPVLRDLGDIRKARHGYDQNFATINFLTRYAAPGSSVAVYTLALFSAGDRVYEPNALRLLAHLAPQTLHVGYFWDIGDYKEVMQRLRRSNYRYLLLDSFPSYNATARNEPYVHFAVDLLQRLKQGEAATPGLRVITRFSLGEREQTFFRILPEPGAANDANLAADAGGATALASESQLNFPASNLNDGTDAAWGSLEGKSDVFARVVLPEAQKAAGVQLKLFSPGGRSHLRDIRIVSAPSEAGAQTEWHFLRARLKGAKEFAGRVTVPDLADNAGVSIELDPTDPELRPRRVWGFACLRSQGDQPNYLPVGTGVYVRELEIR